MTYHIRIRQLPPTSSLHFPTFTPYVTRPSAVPYHHPIAARANQPERVGFCCGILWCLLFSKKTNDPVLDFWFITTRREKPSTSPLGSYQVHLCDGAVASLVTLEEWCLFALFCIDGTSLRSLFGSTASQGDCHMLCPVCGGYQ